MRKLITSLALAILATTCVAAGAQADTRSCLKAPKDYLPCPVTPINPKLSNAGSKTQLPQ